MLGRSGLKVSPLALGTMGFGSDWHGVGAVEEKTARILVDLALDAGVNLLDTADIYGRGASETMLGKILKGRRDRVLIATKVLGQMKEGVPSSGGLSRRHILQAAEGSLKRLKTDHIDLYMPHGWDPEVRWEESFEAFSRLVKDGKVRVLGVSNFGGSHLAEARKSSEKNKGPRLEFDQVQYSLACRFIEDDLLPASRKEKVSILAWSPLGGGLLSGKYPSDPSRPRPTGRRKIPGTAFPSLPEGRLGGMLDVLRKVAQMEGLTPAQAALGWVMGRPEVASAVVGVRTPAQLKDCLGARPLSARSAAFLEQASNLCLKA